MSWEPFPIRLSRTGNYTPTAAAAAEALAVDDGSFALLRNAVNRAVDGDETLLVEIPDLAKRALLPFGGNEEVRMARRHAVLAQLDRCIVAFPQPEA